LTTFLAGNFIYHCDIRHAPKTGDVSKESILRNEKLRNLYRPLSIDRAVKQRIQLSGHLEGRENKYTSHFGGGTIGNTRKEI